MSTCLSISLNPFSHIAFLSDSKYCSSLTEHIQSLGTKADNATKTGTPKGTQTLILPKKSWCDAQKAEYKLLIISLLRKLKYICFKRFTRISILQLACGLAVQKYQEEEK